MVNLLIVVGNLHIGGGQVVVRKLIENLDLNRYNINVICCAPKANTLIEECIESICKVEYLNTTSGLSLRSLVYTLKKISSYNPDLIHAHLGGVNYAMAWALLHNKRIVVTVHTKPDHAFSGKVEKLLRIGIKKNLVYLVAVSKENKRFCKDYFNLNDNQCFCVNNGVDVGKYSGTPHEFFTFINVATQNQNKNQRLILESFIRLLKLGRKVKLILVGDGPEHEKLMDFVRKNNIEKYVVFTGTVDDPTKYYLTSDVYVQSSHREAMPMSVLEAMGIGLPIISTDVGGLKDVVIDNGILVSDGNKEEMYEAMIKMALMNEKDIILMGNRSKELASEYSAESMAKQYMEIFDIVVKTSQV